MDQAVAVLILAAGAYYGALAVVAIVVIARAYLAWQRLPPGPY